MDDQNREYEDYEALHDELFALLDQHRMKALSQKLGEMNEFDISEFLGELWEDNPQRMAMVFRILSKEIAAAVFANLEVEEQETIINSITDTELAGIIEELYVDDAVDMMEELPANVVKRVMRTATPATRALINQYLKYPENSAGSIMTAEFVDLKKYMSVREAFARIRKIGEDKETIYVCYVTSAKRKLEGVVTVKDLLLSDDDVILEDIMDTNVIYATTGDDQEEVSEMISNYDLLAIPVVDKEGLIYLVNSLYFLLTIGELALVFMLSARVQKMSIDGARAAFFGYAILNGMVLSYYFLMFSVGTLVMAFLATAVYFGLMAVYGTTTHKDLTGWGPRLMMALVAMIVTSLVGALFGFGFGASVLYCGIGLVVFMLLTAYDTQKLRQIYAYYAGDTEMAEKASIYGALTLYLDFINIFLYVVRLLGMNSRSRNN